MILHWAVGEWPDVSTLKDKTISSLLWKFLERGGNSLAMLVIQIVLARLLTPDDFGVLAIMLVFINISMVLVQSGLGTALIQAKKMDDVDCSTVFWLSMAVAFILYIAIFACAPTIADFYHAQGIEAPLRVFALILFLYALSSVQIAKVTRDLELRKTFIATIASILISGAVGIVAALLGGGVWALVLQQVVFQVVTCIVLAFQVSWHPSLDFSLERAKVLFGFSWKLLVSGLLDTAYTSLTSLIIGKFSKTELGYVSQGEKYPQALGSLLDGTIQPVMLSAISRVQHDLVSVREITRRAIKTSSFLVVPAMGALALMTAPLISVLLGDQWLPSTVFMQMFCFVYALHPIHTSNLQAINGMGRSDVFLKLEIVKKIIGVSIICFAAFVIQDVFAIVAGMVLSSVIATFVNALPNKRLIGYSYWAQLRDICPSFVLTVVAMAICWPLGLLGLPYIALIVLQSVLFAIVYIGLAKLLKIEALEYLITTMRGRFGLD